VRVLLQKRCRRRQLETEAELEPSVRAHTLVGGADLCLALFAQGEVRPDMRRRKQDRGPVLRRAATERQSILDRRGPVVTGRDDMRVTVDEATIHLPSSTC